MQVPTDNSFSNENYLRHLKIKTQLVDDDLAKEMEKHPKRPIHTIMPGQGGPNLEPVVVAGVAFYLDHENQMVIPMEPAALPNEHITLSKSNSKASLSKYTGSK